jgi:hypothetical protein
VPFGHSGRPEAGTENGIVAALRRAAARKILEFIPSENCFLVRAGVGWGDGVIGVATVGSDLASPAGFALQTGKPVISNHLEHEERFRTPEILLRHNIRRAMNVILQGEGKPYGVLEVDSQSEDEFDTRDLAFLQGAANILGMAIERERHERNLNTALERYQVLLKEMNHRVKNSLTIVGSVLHLQASQQANTELTRHLKEAASRVTAIAKVRHSSCHDRRAYAQKGGRRSSRLPRRLLTFKRSRLFARSSLVSSPMAKVLRVALVPTWEAVAYSCANLP